MNSFSLFKRINCKQDFNFQRYCYHYYYHYHYYYYYYYYYDDDDDDDDDDVKLSTGIFPGEKYPVKSHPGTSDFKHFSEDMCRSEECRNRK